MLNEEIKISRNSEVSQISSESGQPIVYKVYKERWIILLSISTLIISNLIQWISFSALIEETNLYYCGPENVSNCQASFLSNQIYQIIAVIMSICGMYFEPKFGILPTLRISAIFNFTGSIIRVISTIPSIESYVLRQILMLSGTTITAIAQMYFVIFSRIAETWFFPKNRATANVACSNSMEIGIVIGTILPSMMISTQMQNNFQNEWDFFKLGLLMTIISLIPLVISFIAQRSVPKTPPSSSSHQTFSDLCVTKEIFKCLKSRQFLIQIIIYSILFGTANAIVFSSDIINLKGYNLKGYPVSVSTLISIISGYLGGFIADKTRKFREISTINTIVSLLSIIALRFYLLKTYSAWYDSVIVLSILSVTMSCCAINTPIGNEMAVETTFPINETISNGILSCFCQFWLFCIYYILDALKNTEFLYKTEQNENWQLSLDFWILISLINSIIAIFFLKPTYNRMKTEENN